MSIHLPHLRAHVVVPVLLHLGERLASPAAVELMLGTLAAESDMGRYLVQLPRRRGAVPGPALGICQMEPATVRDNAAWLAFHPILLLRVQKLAASWGNWSDELPGNLNLAVALMRIHYWRRPEPLAAAGNIAGHAAYWKRYYNTPLGAGTEDYFLKAWRNHVAPHL